MLHTRIELCRCLRDKIGEGKCAILCSIFDRIGGNVLDYQDKQKSRRWKRITAPKHHGGKYSDDALRFEENLLLVAPSKYVASPSTVLIFELFLLKSKTFSHDQVFGWGAFPLLNGELEYNKGKFKIPLLYGPVDYSILKYADIEKRIRYNLDTWLCNLYFSIEPREPLANPYTTQLDIDNEANQKIVQVLEIGDDDKDMNGQHQDNKYMPLDHASSHSGIPSPDQAPPGEILDQNQMNAKLSNLLKEEDSDSDFGNPHGKKTEYIPLEKFEDFEPYNFHIPHLDFKSRASFTNQVGYIMEEILADLGFRNVMSCEFWGSLIILLLAMWLRAYLHPFGSWIFLIMDGIPITTFNPLLYGFDLNYPPNTIGVEIGVILFGNIFVTIVFLFFIFMCWLLEKILGGNPNIIYRFVAAFGISTVADFILLMVVDLATSVKKYQNHNRMQQGKY